MWLVVSNVLAGVLLFLAAAVGLWSIVVTVCLDLNRQGRVAWLSPPEGTMTPEKWLELEKVELPFFKKTFALLFVFGMLFVLL